MKLTEFFRNEIDREVERSRKALEQVPDGKFDWKPHEKSMIFGYLANMVATIPMWITMEINQDELDIHPPAGEGMKQERPETKDALLQALDMPTQERRTRMLAMRRIVAGRNVFGWASDILEGLESLWTKPLEYAARAPEDAPV